MGIRQPYGEKNLFRKYQLAPYGYLGERWNTLDFPDVLKRLQAKGFGEEVSESIS